MDEPRFTLLDTVDEELKNAVIADLRHYNRSRNAAWFEALAAPGNAARPLNVFALDAAGQPLGGLLGETQLAWLKIQYVSIRADARRHGLGTRLMELAEREAASRGCKYAFLDTMSYQAPDFYQKLGYQIAGQLDDWDSHGHAKFFLVKTLGGTA
jgi:ribosomal protein S18 acetylase RimI-like enzyme